MLEEDLMDFKRGRDEWQQSTDAGEPLKVPRCSECGAVKGYAFGRCRRCGRVAQPLGREG